MSAPWRDIYESYSEISKCKKCGYKALYPYGYWYVVNDCWCGERLITERFKSKVRHLSCKFFDNMRFFNSKELLSTAPQYIKKREKQYVVMKILEDSMIKNYFLRKSIYDSTRPQFRSCPYGYLLDIIKESKFLEYTYEKEMSTGGGYGSV